MVAASDVRTPISNSEVHTELPSLARDSNAVLEFLEINIWSRDLQTFLDADSKIWTHFLSSQPGFIRKEVMTNPHDPAAGNCTVTQTIL